MFVATMCASLQEIHVGRFASIMFVDGELECHAKLLRLLCINQSKYNES
jgi:hypothetical protein